MNIKNSQKRMQMFAGKVDQKHIQSIVEHINGKNVLDMGSGYGSTTAKIQAAGFNCIGIDYDQPTLDIAKSIYPECNFQYCNAEQLPFEDNSFDVIVMRDALHHFYQEADFNKVKAEILRVSTKNARIIVLDPNVSFMLKTMRKIMRHKDAECAFETAQAIMKDMGYNITYSRFHTLYSLPLSGGYVGINFVPNISILQSFILKSEKLAEKVVNGLRLGRQICWRYVIVVDRK
jgi:ubiquinone/menaquinone biosynthesis C-methylase UbiE